MREGKRVTIKDVAREAGLAFSTVSNALSGKGYVREETRQLVMSVVARLGYRASAVARTMRSKRSSIIGVMIADVSNPSSADFVRGVEDALLQQGCTMLLCNTDGDEARQISLMRTLLDHEVDGIVMISQHSTGLEIEHILARAPPVVWVQRRGHGPCDYVGSDNRYGIVSAMEHLRDLGHRRIGFVRGPHMSSSAQERLSTFLSERGRLGFETSHDLVQPGEYTFESGMAAAEYFLALVPRPSAILCSSDMNAMGIMQRLLETGLRIPTDISIVGLDNIALADFRTINLTTIHLDKRGIGMEAANALLRRIADPGMPLQTIILPTQLVRRGTTGPCEPGCFAH